MKTAGKKKTAAFTLIELLASVSIVAVLAAVAVPTFGTMREKGNETDCLGNGRQLGLAMTRYAAEHSNAINGLGQVDEGGSFSNWMNRMSPYFEVDRYADIRSNFICRSHPKFVRDNDAHFGWAINTQFIPTETGLKRHASVSNPARTIYAAEGYRDFDWQAGDGHKDGFTVPKAFAKKNTIAAGERVFFPHRGRTVAVFLDGHSELLAAPIPRDLWAVEK